MHATGLSLLRLDLISFVVLACLVFGYIGLLPLYFDWDKYRTNIIFQNRELFFYVLLGSSWSIFSLVMGSAIARVAFKHNLKIPICPVQNHKTFYIKFIIIFLIIILTIRNYLMAVPEIAIVHAINGSISDAESARSLMGSEFSGKYHWYSLIMHDFSYLCVYILFATWLIKKTKIDLFLFLCFFIMASFTSVMAIEKGPFIWLLIGLIIVWILNRHQGVVNLIKIWPLFVFGLLILAFIYVSFEGSPTVADGITASLSRALTGSILPAYYYLEFFPGQHDFLYGRSFPNPGGIFPWETFRLTEEVMNWSNGSDYGVVRSAPTIFWTELYANFGLFGAFFFPVFVGFILFMIQAFLMKLPDSPIRLGYYVWILIHFKNLSISPFSSFLFDIYFIGVTLLVLMLCFRWK